jgi:hypothetical protein
MRMQAWSLSRKRLTQFLREKVARDFANDPLVEIHEISNGEFRIRIGEPSGAGPRYFRVKIIEEKQ